MVDISSVERLVEKFEVIVAREIEPAVRRAVREMTTEAAIAGMPLGMTTLTSARGAVFSALVHNAVAWSGVVASEEILRIALANRKRT